MGGLNRRGLFADVWSSPKCGGGPLGPGSRPGLRHGLRFRLGDGSAAACSRRVWAPRPHGPQLLIGNPSEVPRRLFANRRCSKQVAIPQAIRQLAARPVKAPGAEVSLGLLRARLEPSFTPPADARDHHEHPWVLEHLPGVHPRA